MVHPNINPVTWGWDGTRPSNLWEIGKGPWILSGWFKSTSSRKWSHRNQCMEYLPTSFLFQVFIRDSRIYQIHPNSRFWILFTMRSFLLKLGLCKVTPVMGRQRREDSGSMHPCCTYSLVTTALLTRRTVNRIGIHLHPWIGFCLELFPTHLNEANPRAKFPTKPDSSSIDFWRCLHGTWHGCFLLRERDIMHLCQPTWIAEIWIQELVIQQLSWIYSPEN